MNIFQSILFPPPPSLFLNAMSVVSLVMLANLGISEVRGKHLTYSKFWNSQAKPAEKKENKSGSIMLPGKVGMLLLYSPAVAASVAAFFVPGVMAAPHGALVSVALGIHFFKRDLEVLFVHRFSSNMALDTSLGISSSYLFNTVCSIYSQYLSRGMLEPTIDLTYVGIIVFLIGISGNFYHHYILSTLRKEGDKSYKIPTGGLFNVVICPHYLFEVIGLFGIALISQTIFSFVFAFGSMCYLMGRSYATRNWYMSKFEDFPVGSLIQRWTYMYNICV